MTDKDAEELNDVRARLEQSRTEVRLLLDPPVPVPGEPGAADAQNGFPRSRTMRLLMSSSGLGALGVLASGFLIARPGLAFRLLRLLPAGGVAKIIIARVLSAIESAPRDRSG